MCIFMSSWTSSTQSLAIVAIPGCHGRERLTRNDNTWSQKPHQPWILKTSHINKFLLYLLTLFITFEPNTDTRLTRITLKRELGGTLYNILANCTDNYLCYHRIHCPAFYFPLIRFLCLLVLFCCSGLFVNFYH